MENVIGQESCESSCRWERRKRREQRKGGGDEEKNEHIMAPHVWAHPHARHKQAYIFFLKNRAIFEQN